MTISGMSRQDSRRNRPRVLYHTEGKGVPCCLRVTAKEP